MEHEASLVECECNWCMKRGAFARRSDPPPPSREPEPPRFTTQMLPPALFALAVMLVAGCAHVPVREQRAHWEHLSATVYASNEMSPTCRASVAASLAYLSAFGVHMDLVWVPEDHRAILLEPREGEIAVHAGIPSRPDVGAETYVWRRGDFISRAEIVLGSCDPWICAHEFLHTQGLEDLASPESLMHFSTQHRRWGLSPMLREWVSQ